MADAFRHGYETWTPSLRLIRRCAYCMAVFKSTRWGHSDKVCDVSECSSATLQQKAFKKTGARAIYDYWGKSYTQAVNTTTLNGAIMKEVKTKLKVFLVLFVLVTAVGTLGFMQLESLSFTDALYYNIVTMSTVGFGDIHPNSPLSRMFTVLLILAGGGAFLGVVANTTEIVILKRDSSNRMRKINMVLGVFFSEVGNHLLGLFARHHENAGTLKNELRVTPEWTHEQFSGARKKLAKIDLKLDSSRMDLSNLNEFMKSKRDFFVGLLENPVLIEHEGLSESLLAVFHLQDELHCREDFNDLPDTDRQHLTGDMNRIYGQLVDQWLIYLEHLKEQYPYIFSLAIRNNPFELDASPVVRG